MTRLGCFFTIVLMLFILPLSGTGQIPGPSVSLGVNATVSLDVATRRLLENFPDKMHDTVLSIIRDSAPLLLNTANEFLNKFKQTGDQLIVDAKCAAIGGAGGVVRKIPGFRVLTIDELNDTASKRLSQLGRASTPQDYFDAYSGLSDFAGTIVCEEKGISGTSDASEHMNGYDELGFMWHRLAGKCDNAMDCFDKEYSATNTLIGNSEQRDKDSANVGSDDLKAISRPSAWSFFKPKPYEEALQKLLGIQDKLWWAKSRREFMAATLVDEAEASMTNSVDVKIHFAQTWLVPQKDAGKPNCPPYVPWTYTQLAIQLGAKAEAEEPFPGIEPKLRQAVALDAVNQRKHVDTLTLRLKQEQADITALQSAKKWVLNPVTNCPQAP